MKDIFRKTKMMAEAKLAGKAHTPLVETLIFIAVFYVGNIAQYILLIPGFFYYIFTDDSLLGILETQSVPDINAVYKQMTELLYNIPEWLLVYSLSVSVAVIIAVIVYCKCIDKRSLASIGLRKGNIAAEYFVGLFVGVAAVSLIALVIDIADIAVFSFSYISPLFIAAYIFAFAIKGFADVLLIQGYYMTSLSKSSNVIYSLFCSSFLYATLNMMSTYFDLLYFINSFMIGFVFGAYVIKRGNIWGAAALSCAWNFASNVIFGFNSTGILKVSSMMTTTFDSGFDTLSGGALGFEGGLFTTLIVFLLVGALCVIPQNKNEIYKEKPDEE